MILRILLSGFRYVAIFFSTPERVRVQIGGAMGMGARRIFPGVGKLGVWGPIFKKS